jgi:predicted N-acetyltransferase YhbS
MTYHVCPPNPVADRQAILELWQRNLPEADPSRFAWLYDRGPTQGLVLRSDADEAVGSTGLMRRTLRAFGRDVEAAQAVDLNVDRQHRTIGPALALQRAAIDSARQAGLPLIYGFPNPQSEAVLRRAGYREIGRLGRWVKPLSSRRLALPSWLAFAADRLLPLVSPETYRRLPAGLRAERIGRFDERFDRLFEAATARLPIVGHRTAAYLAWRFARRPHVGHHAIGLFDRGNGLLAYVVWRWHRGTACVGDLLAAEPTHLEMLLAELLRRLRRRQTEAVVVSYLGHGDVCAVLARLGFWPRPLDWKAMLHIDPAAVGPDVDRWLRPDHWYLTRADLDTDE